MAHCYGCDKGAGAVLIQLGCDDEDGCRANMQPVISEHFKGVSC